VAHDAPGAAAVATDVPAPIPEIALAGTPRARPGAPVTSLTKQLKAPVLDGRLDDWQGDALEIDNVAFGEQYWDGPADLSARAFLAWDDAALLVGVRVTDDVYSQPSTGQSLHLGDSVELQLDTDLEGDWNDATYNGDDWQIGLSAGNFTDHPPEAYVWRPAGVDASPIAVAGRRLPTGYIIEASLPWSLLGVSPADRDRIGIAVNVGDDDSPEPAQVTMLSSVPKRSWSDPRTFGTLILSR
jgi:hypothetical protein